MSRKTIDIYSEKYTYEYFCSQNVCRLCWEPNVQRVILENEDEKNTLAYKIKHCLDIDLLSHWTEFNKFCSNCIREVTTYYDFKLFCHELNTKFQAIINAGSQLENVEIKIESTELPDVDYSTDSDSIINDFIPLNKSKKSNVKRLTKSLRNLPSVCNKCHIDFKTEESLSKHNLETHGLEPDGSFRCFGCVKKFKTPKRRRNHEVYFCKGLKNGYKCPICNGFLPKRKSYETHMRDHVNNVANEVKLPEKLFKCDKCVIYLKTEDCLKKHLAEHDSKKREFVCDTCGRIFSRRDYLYKHQLMHAGIKKYACSYCDFRATQRSSMTIHIRKHTGDRPYSCDMCPQKCISSSNLGAHRRRHHGLTKFECTICNKKFGYKISLQEHISSAHDRTEIHTCDHCGATYTRKRGLRRHIITKHGTCTDKKIIDTTKEVENTEGPEKNGILSLQNQNCQVFLV